MKLSTYGLSYIIRVDIKHLFQRVKKEEYKNHPEDEQISYIMHALREYTNEITQGLIKNFKLNEEQIKQLKKKYHIN